MTVSCLRGTVGRWVSKAGPVTVGCLGGKHGAQFCQRRPAAKLHASRARAVSLGLMFDPWLSASGEWTPVRGGGRGPARRRACSTEKVKPPSPPPPAGSGASAAEGPVYRGSPSAAGPWESGCRGNRPGARQLRISSLEPARDGSGGGGARHRRRPRRRSPRRREWGARGRGRRTGARDRGRAAAGGPPPPPCLPRARGGRGRPRGQRRGGLRAMAPQAPAAAAAGVRQMMRPGTRGAAAACGEVRGGRPGCGASSGETREGTRGEGEETVLARAGAPPQATLGTLQPGPGAARACARSRAGGRRSGSLSRAGLTSGAGESCRNWAEPQPCAAPELRDARGRVRACERGGVCAPGWASPDGCTQGVQCCRVGNREACSPPPPWSWEQMEPG